MTAFADVQRSPLSQTSLVSPHLLVLSYLADGSARAPEIAEIAGTSRMTVFRWLCELEALHEVERRPDRSWGLTEIGVRNVYQLRSDLDGLVRRMTTSFARSAASVSSPIPRNKPVTGTGRLVTANR